jgi:dephospho-CoA kinase
MRLEAGKCYALTGGIACGKSTVLEMLREAGVEVVDADDLSHEWLEGEEGKAAVAAAFGLGMLDGKGEVDRRALGRLVFGDAAARAKLEGLVHPYVRRRLAEWREEVKKTGRAGVAAIPLLYEAGMDGDGWDGVICVTAPEAAMLERLKGRGLDEAESRAQMASQWPVAEKARRADAVIENGETREELRAAVAALSGTNAHPAKI